MDRTESCNVAARLLAGLGEMAAHGLTGHDPIKVSVRRHDGRKVRATHARRKIAKLSHSGRVRRLLADDADVVNSLRVATVVDHGDVPGVHRVAEADDNADVGPSYYARADRGRSCTPGLRVPDQTQQERSTRPCRETVLLVSVD